jgi:uncharacterized protein YhdP
LSFAERPAVRVVALALLGTGVFFASVVLAYELAVARVPAHRAALEQFVRAETGLEVRFGELALRWGWYGPEAVFRRVELGEPGRSEVLLRAPELVVGFDAWRSMRSGRLEPGRITLVSPDVDLVGVAQGGADRAAGADRLGRGARGAAAGALQAGAADGAHAAQLRMLRHWRGGRIDIEGGTLRLPDPAGAGTPLTLQLRQASLRHSSSEWSAYGLVFLPEQLGRTARVVLRLDGDPEQPDTLSASVRFEGRRLLFSGWRPFLADVPRIRSILPIAGDGDVDLNVVIEKGQLLKADGKVHAAGVEIARGTDVLALDRLRGEWRLARRASTWRMEVDSLELGDGSDSWSIGSAATQLVGSLRRSPATVTLDGALGGAWVRGKVASAPLPSVVTVVRWLAPNAQLPALDLAGTVRNLTFDWNELRPEGARLQTSAQLDAVRVGAPSRAFSLSDLTARVTGNESELTADVEARMARLEMAQAPDHPLENLQVASRLRFTRADEGWRVATDEDLAIRGEQVRLVIRGAVVGDFAGSVPEIEAHGTLTGGDIAFLRTFADTGFVQTGRVENAQFELRGPLDEALAYRTDAVGFSGSLDLRDASARGGELWPDAMGIEAHVQWHGSKLETAVERGQAGSFQLGPVKAEWDALDGRSVRVSGRVTGHLQDALAWLRAHPKLQEYVPTAQMSIRGDAAVDFNVVAGPPSRVDAPSGEVRMRVSALLDGAELEAVAGVPAVEGVRGALTFNQGHLERSTLTGTWLGGPVILRVGERRERGVSVVAIEARGVLDPRQLQLPDTATGSAALQGTTEWTGELAYVPASGSRAPWWRVRADSSLVGILSNLPEPLGKGSGSALPLHAEAQGSGDSAELRVSIGDRLRSVWALRRDEESPWGLERGHVKFGSIPVRLPAEPVVWVEGHVGRLDLPAYLTAWREFRNEVAGPPVRAELVARQMLAGARSFSDVSLHAQRRDGADELFLESGDLSGRVRLPAQATGGVDLSFARLNIPGEMDGGSGAVGAPGAGAASVRMALSGLGALGRAVSVEVDQLAVAGRELGRFTAGVVPREGGVDVTDMRLVGNTQHGRGSMRCESETCRLKFSLDSGNAAATLEAFGFRADLAAADATVEGDLQWQLGEEQPAIATLAGRLSMRLEDGFARAGRGAVGEGRPFALLSIPALVSGLMQPSGDATQGRAGDEHELRFSRLAADFDLSGGQASTSNLHFDGDAEILIRGRTGLLTRDYDQQVWILRGEERLPAAVRRFGPTPRVAAVWLSLREMFAGAEEDRARTMLRLQGSWDDPIVVRAE